MVVTTTLLPLYWGVTIAMVYIIARVLKWCASISDQLDALLALFVLAMMASMFGGAVVYFWSPSSTSLLIALLINTVVMITVFLPILSALLKAAASPERTSAPLRSRAWFTGLVISLTLLNEFFMGWTFNLLSGIPKPSFGLLSTPEYFSQIISSYWFVFPMALEMVLTSVMLRSRIRVDIILLVGMQSAIMLFTPTAIPSHAWGFISAFLGSALMNVLFGWVYLDAYLRGGLERGLESYVLRLFLIYALMMGGLYMWSSDGELGVFALSVVLEMVLYFDAVLGRMTSPSGKGSVRWRWVAATFTAASASMIFMGGLIARTGITQSPSPFRGGLVFPQAGLDGITLVVTLAIMGVGLLYSLFAFGLEPYSRLKASLVFPKRLLLPAAIIGFALLPAADLTPLDQLGDANPPFHMLEHLVIGIGGLIAGVSLSGMANIREGSPLHRLYVWYTEASRGGLAIVVMGAILLALWFSPQLFTLIYYNEVLHGAMHITIFLLGFLGGASFKTLERGLKLFLLVTFSWMAPMMAPFSFILGAYAYGNPAYFVPAMSAAMEVWVAGIFAAPILYVLLRNTVSRHG